MKIFKRSSSVLKDDTISEFNDCILNIKEIKERIKKDENPLNVMVEHNNNEFSLDYVKWMCSFKEKDFSWLK